MSRATALYAPKVMRFVATGLYPAIRGSTPRGCTMERKPDGVSGAASKAVGPSSAGVRDLCVPLNK